MINKLSKSFAYNNTLADLKIVSSRNPIKLFKAMNLYSIERKEKNPLLRALMNSLNVILSNSKFKYIKDLSGNILAAYTYKCRETHSGKKSFYIDTLVRNRAMCHSKFAIIKLYNDMSQTVKEKALDELALFSPLKDKKLKENYYKLGFKNDEKTFVHGGFILRAKPQDFKPNI